MLAEELVRQCPFWDGNLNKIKVPIRMLRDLVLVWAPETPEKVGHIIIPETARGSAKYCSLGVILSVGKGYDNGKRFYPMLLKPEQVIYFDKHAPWRVKIKHDNGTEHELRYMGERDIKLLVEPDQELDLVGDLLSQILK